MNPEPNLVVLGAQKSGTTSLHEYLKAHPDIFMSTPIKEPGYYLGEERARIFWKAMGSPISDRAELLKERMLVGYSGQRWFGDASTYYTIGERSRRFGIPKRMYDANPEMRFIYIMRDPIERIVSNYWHCKSRGKAEADLIEFLKTNEGRIALRTSQYQYQLDAYLEYFPPHQFCVLQFEDLRTSPEDVMRQIWSFLSIPPVKVTEYRKYNESHTRDDQQTVLRIEQREFLQKNIRRDVLRLAAHWNIKTEHWILTHTCIPPNRK